MNINIFHLSDLHFINDVENRFRIKELIKDIKSRTKTEYAYTAISGDIVFSGDENDFDILFDLLIGPLVELGHEIFIVPGNHDVQRSIANNEFCAGVLSNRGSSYLFRDSQSIIKTHPSPEFDSLKHYRELEDVLGPYEYRNNWGYSATRKGVSFIGMNSAWLCCERPHRISDRGLLRVEPAVLSEILLRLPSNTLKIALMHHPVDWLEENTRSAINDLLIEHTDLVLFGHVHAKDMIISEKENANCLFLQAPPLRADWSKGTNGYSIIHADTDHKRFQIEFRSYSKPRRQFVRGEDFAAGGIRYPRDIDKVFFSTSPLQSNLIQRYVDSGPFDYSDWYKINIRAKSKIDGGFIIPNVHLITDTDEGQFVGPALKIDRVVCQSKRDQYFVAPLDAGSTTAAYLTFKQLSETFDEHSQIPAYFDASEDKINRATILRGISRTALVKYTKTEAEQLVTDGSVVVVVDGLCLGDIAQFNFFRQTAENYFPKVRFIYFLSTERRGAVPTGEGEVNLSSNLDEIYEFSQLGVAEIRSMIELKMPEMEQEIQEGIVRQVVESFRQMDEPIYASTVSVVIETFSHDLEFRPVNKARLIERYVECLLGRFDLEDIREGVFTSSDKIDYLSFLARELLIKDRRGFLEDEWHSIERSYQNKFLIELPNDLLDEFVTKGLLTLDKSEITFRGDHLFSFFTARQMKSDQEFATSLLKGNGLLKFHREITVYGELEGSDISSVLNRMHDEIKNLSEALLKTYETEGIDLQNEWEIVRSESNYASDFEALGEAAEQLDNTSPTGEDADKIDNAELSRISRRRGISTRLDVRELEAKLLVSLRLYSQLLKNSLYLEGDQKLRHLRKLFDVAELWVGFICSCREYIGRAPITIIGGVRIINHAATNDISKSLQNLKFNTPNSMATMLAAIMRNPQLLPAIKKLLPELPPMSALFARQILLESPSAANRKSYIDSLRKEENIDLVTCSLRAIRMKYLSTGRNQERKKFLEGLLNSIAQFPSVSNSLNLHKIKKEKLIQDLKNSSKSQEV